MNVVSHTDFRAHLAENLDTVNVDKDILVVSRSKGRNVVVLDMDEYNAMQETLHLLSTKANRTGLQRSL